MSHIFYFLLYFATYIYTNFVRFCKLGSTFQHYPEASKSRLNVKENAVPAGNCMFKVNNRNTRTRCEICSKLTIKTPERR